MSNCNMDRILGTLLGQFCGDAIGAQVEFKSVARIHDYFPGRTMFMAPGGTFGLAAGQITDDSEMAIALIDSFTDGRYDQKAALAGYWKWLASAPFDCGNTIREALSRGYRNPASEANGALMRISPLGALLRHAGDETIARCAAEDARLTHIAQICQDCNAAYCIAIADLVAGGTAESAHSRALQWAKTHAKDMRCVRMLEESLSSRPGSYTKSCGWVAIAFQNAFYQLMNAESVEDATADTVLRGGDTDTNAAIAGALAGARDGAASFPEGWLEDIENCAPADASSGTCHPRPAWCHPARIHELARKLQAENTPQR